MKKQIFLIAALLSGICLMAQTYNINFAGSGASAVVSTVKVENQSTGEIVNLNGNDILSLVLVPSFVNNVYGSDNGKIRVLGSAGAEQKIEYTNDASERITLEVIDLSGRKVAALNSQLGSGTHTFLVNGLNAGVYVVSVTSQNTMASAKLYSNGADRSSVPTLSLHGSHSNAVQNTNTAGLKSAQSTVSMNYTAGERLKFTGTSGNYKTVVSDVPTSNKTITFGFVACTDADNNHYPVVQIGFQLWMAENLKTTKFKSGVDIFYPGADSALWVNDSSGAYAWYDNDISNKDVYGALYNWYTVVNTDSLCPAGWRIPGVTDFSILESVMGDSRFSGGKLKDKSTAHWKLPNAGASDEYGFTALPAGSRGNVDARYYQFGEYGYWWTNGDGLNDPKVYCTLVRYDFANSDYFPIFKNIGISVRCVKE